MILGYAPAQEFLFQHFKNGRLAAAANASQYLDKGLVDKRRDSRNVARSVDHSIASFIVIIITKTISTYNKFFWSNLKNFQTA